MRWVYAADGTLQCGLGLEISLDEMARSLSKLIGSGKILAQEKSFRPGRQSSRCGSPTGWVNAYALDDEGYLEFTWGFTGQPPPGWLIWNFGTSAPVASLPVADAAVDSGRITTLGPEVPLSGAGIAELLCRDCGFPMKPGGRANTLRGPDDREPEAGKTRDFEAAILSQLIRQATSVTAAPAVVRDLIGLTLRVWPPGAIGTTDYNPDRVNVYVDEKWLITDIGFG